MLHSEFRSSTAAFPLKGKVVSKNVVRGSEVPGTNFVKTTFPRRLIPVDEHQNLNPTIGIYLERGKELVTDEPDDLNDMIMPGIA